jgi:hypothetical protein
MDDDQTDGRGAPLDCLDEWLLAWSTKHLPGASVGDQAWMQAATKPKSLWQHRIPMTEVETIILARSPGGRSSRRFVRCGEYEETWRKCECLAGYIRFPRNKPNSARMAVDRSSAFGCVANESIRQLSSRTGIVARQPCGTNPTAGFSVRTQYTSNSYVVSVSARSCRASGILACTCHVIGIGVHVP